MQVGAKYLGNHQCEFTVWGPTLDFISVQLVSQNDRLMEMAPLENGYWRVVADDVKPGDCYVYQLNGGESRPDPASHYQPQGVHGPSQVVDHQYDWTDQTWKGVPLESMVLYETHVGTFTPEGTFDAIIPRLKELRELGVTALEIMPVAQFPGNHPPNQPSHEHDYRNWGYDGAYLYAVQNSYGGPEGLKRLADACHREGISLVLDVVYNHFGPEGNYISQYGPYFTEVYLTPWGSAVNFDDKHSPEVRNFFIQNALYWMRNYHIDALRLDAIQAIYDLGAFHILEELSENVSTLSEEMGRPFYLIAESDLNDPQIIRSREHCGYGIDAQWSDDFHHALQTLLAGDNIGYYEDYGKCEDLAKAFRQNFVYDWQYSGFRQRNHGKFPKGCTPKQFVVCIQNHDQIGNRLLGDRLSTRIPFEGLKLSAGAVILSPYTPLLFMGEEYGEEAPFTYFVSHSDPELIQAVRQGRKREFAEFHSEGEALDPEAVDTFLRCKVSWEKRKEGNHQVLRSFYQHLIQLRNTLPSLLHQDFGAIEAGSDEDKRLVWWRRWNEKSQVLCLMNFNQNAITVEPPGKTQQGSKVLDSTEEKWAGPGASAPDAFKAGEAIALPPQSFVLYGTP